MLQPQANTGTSHTVKGFSGTTPSLTSSLLPKSLTINLNGKKKKNHGLPALVDILPSLLKECFYTGFALTSSEGGRFAPGCQKESLGYTLPQAPHL